MVEALGGVTDSGDTASLIQQLSTLALYAQHRPPPSSSPAGLKPSKPLTSKSDYAELQESVDAVEHRATVKVSDQRPWRAVLRLMAHVCWYPPIQVVPERIYSAVVHPDSTRDLVFVGDKGGHIGLWDATEAGLMVTVPGDDEDEEDQEVESKGSFWHWRAHNRTVSTLKIPPADPMYIYSSSYDCTIRRTNFETGMSEEVLDGDHWQEQDNLIHSFDLEPNGQILWCEWRSSRKIGADHDKSLMDPCSKRQQRRYFPSRHERTHEHSETLACGRQ